MSEAALHVLWDLPAHAITVVNDKKKLDIKLKVALFFPQKSLLHIAMYYGCILELC